MPAGTAIAMSVSTRAFPRAGIVVFWALQVVMKESAVPAVVAIVLTKNPLSASAHGVHTCINHTPRHMRSLLWESLLLWKAS